MDGVQYEREAWDRLQDLKGERLRARAVHVVPQKVRERAVKVQQQTLDFLQSVPGAEVLQLAVVKSLDGANRVLGKAGTSSVSRKRLLRAYSKRGHEISELHELRQLPLRDIDAVKPKGMDLAYSAFSGVTGAASAAAVTGGQIAATAGSVFSAGAAAAPGAGVVAGAIATDAALTLSVLQRGLAHVAAYYGYDVRRPEERIFALAVMNAALVEGAGKGAVYAQLSRLTQDLARRRAWARLQEHALTRITQAVYRKLGMNLTQRKLGAVVPVVGVVLGAGLNARLLDSALEEFDLLYRERFLVDRYGPSGPPGARPPVMTSEGVETAGDDRAKDQLDVAEIVEAELLELDEAEEGQGQRGA